MKKQMRSRKIAMGSTLSLTSSVDGGKRFKPRPGRFAPEKETGTHYTGGGVGTRAGVDECGKFRLRRGANPQHSSP
jgi:hypothetical protein